MTDDPEFGVYELAPDESPLTILAGFVNDQSVAKKHLWEEDELFPRHDRLRRWLWFWQRTVRPRHPEWFRPGDIIRPITRRDSREAFAVVAITDGRMRVVRGVGSTRIRPLFAREVFIVASGISDEGEMKSARRYWRQQGRQ